METSSYAAVSQLGCRESKTCMVAALFVIGNIVLPQLCHLIPQGGLIWLPIYFFTLVAAYKYGPVAGLLTAVVSPLVNSAFFGMPAAASLPIILIKSVVLALAASFIGLFAYCLATGGWEAIAGFFAGKWFALIAIVVIVAASLAAWLFLASTAPGRDGRDRDGK